MRARALLGLGATLFLAACAFWSDRAFFAESEAVQPFESGARFVWREGGGGESQTIVFTRAGAGYVLQDVNESDDKPIEMMLVAVPETPEEDFIAQVTLPNAEGVRAYAFLWLAGDGYRMLAAPRALDGLASAESVLVSHCVARPQGECQMGSREGLMAIYRDAIYPRFVTGGAAPSDYMELTPAPNGG